MAMIGRRGAGLKPQPGTGAGPVCQAGGMSRTVPIAIGVVMLVVGGVWTLQGLGYLRGSPMTGVAFWAVLGPLVAGLGVALAYVGLRSQR